MGADPVTLIKRHRTAVACNEIGTIGCRRSRHECVICGASRYTLFRQSKNKVSVSSRAQPEERLGKPRRKEIANDYSGGSMRRGQTG